MRTLTAVTGILLIVGGINWLLIGLFQWDLVAEIFGSSYGSSDVWPRIVYVAVGIAAILHIPALLATLRDATSTRVDTGVRGEPVTYR